MQLPMEKLSLTATRTDSGSGLKARASPVRKDGLLFDKVIENARNAPDPANAGKPDHAGRNAGHNAQQRETTAKAEKRAIDDFGYEDGMAAIAGTATENQEKVVFILEGDKESAAKPEAPQNTAIEPQAETATIAPAPEQANAEAPAETGKASDDPGTGQVPQSFKEAVDAALAAGQAEAAQPPEPAIQSSEGESEVAAAAAVEGNAYAAAATSETLKPEQEERVAAKAEEIALGATEEATARMPATRTSERSEMDKREENPEKSEDGYLSPLENENDKTPVRAKREKESFKTDDAPRETVKIANAMQFENPVQLSAADVRTERFRAGQQIGNTHEMPVRADNLFDEMVYRIETDMTEGTRTMSIQLKPEFLGKVELQIAMDAAGLHVKINAADQGVKAMVNSQINALIETLQNKGIEVVEVEVAYTGYDNGAFKQPGDRNTRQPPQTHRQPGIDKTQDEQDYYAALRTDILEYYLDAGVSSVEYSA